MVQINYVKLPILTISPDASNICNRVIIYEYTSEREFSSPE